MHQQDHPHSGNQEHSMPQKRSPDVLLAIDDGACGTEDFHQRNHTQGDENRPDYLISLEYLSSEIPQEKPCSLSSTSGLRNGLLLFSIFYSVHLTTFIVF